MAKKSRMLVRTNIHGLREMEVVADDGGAHSVLRLMSNPTNHHTSRTGRSVFIEMTGINGGGAQWLTVSLQEAATLADWLTMVSREPNRDSFEDSRTDLRDIHDGRGFKVGFEVGPSERTVNADGQRTNTTER
jgi:hypothetical protein